MKCLAGMHSVSAQANNCPKGLLRRSPNHSLLQKALMEYLLLGRQA